MRKPLKIKRGLNLNLSGGAARPASCSEVAVAEPESVALVPDDFNGLTPKMDVREGDRVDCGDALWHDKVCTEIRVVSPVAGTVKRVVRGERRKVLAVEVVPDKGAPVVSKPGAVPKDAQALKSALMAYGVWAQMRQLPFATVPVADAEPRDIFVTTWDAAPLAPDMSLAIEGCEALLEAGVAALKTLTKGDIYVGRKADGGVSDIAGAVMVDVEGGFPASLPSVLAANIKPVNKGETVWLLDGVTLKRIGQVASGSGVDWSGPVAVTGSEVVAPHYVTAPAGASMRSLVGGGLRKQGHERVISGNVLTGVNVGEDGYLRFPYTQVTVIPEGDDVDEFMGWASLSPGKMSESRSFPGHFLRKRLFKPDARLNGGRRAMILSGQYARYIPMDIMPEHLVKAILARDIDRMEALGIYEVTPADFAAAEYADASKLELQRIVGEGLDYMRQETV